MLWVANTAIELGWVAATTYLIITEHYYWAVAFYIAALVCGYRVKPSKGQGNDS